MTAWQLEDEQGVSARFGRKALENTRSISGPTRIHWARVSLCQAPQGRRQTANHHPRSMTESTEQTIRRDSIRSRAIMQGEEIHFLDSREGQVPVRAASP